MSRAFDAIMNVKNNPIKRSLPPLEIKEKPKVIREREEYFFDENIKKLLQKLEGCLKRIDDVERKLRTSENYLTNYGELQELERDFLSLYLEFEKIKQVDLEEIPSSLINRIRFRKEMIDRKSNRKI